jgi:rRNA maturation RNase YbeY
LTNDFDGTPELDLINDSGTPVPIDEATAHACLHAVSLSEGVTFSMIELVYVTEDEIIDVNKHHLGKDYVTDIISFHYHDAGATVDLEGSLVMCASRIHEQAAELGVSAELEFKRVLVHGLLHLVGHDDTTADLKAAMTRKEDDILSRLG